MSERIRVPRRAPVVTVADGELTATVSGPMADDARRFSMTVAEAALQRMGPVAIEFVTERLAGQIAHEQRAAVEETVHTYLRDRAWAEPIIRQAIQETVRDYVRGMFEVVKNL